VLIAMADAVRSADCSPTVGDRNPIHRNRVRIVSADQRAAVRSDLYDEVVRSGELCIVDDLFHELRRYG
jgi:hypothetical protein